MPITRQDCNALINSLSQPRLNTYLRETKNDILKAIELYQLNAEVSAAFLPSLNICEITIRNAISEALKKRYGDEWARNPGFERSLPNEIRSTLINLTKNGIKKERNGKEQKENLSNDDIIAQLTLHFWQKCCSTGFESSLWKQNLYVSFPNLPKEENTIRENIKLLQGSINQVRHLRNKIAHHGNIFKLNLIGYYQEIIQLTGYRCPVTKSWLESNTWYLPNLIHKIDRLLPNKN
ncbi:Abi family protein [Neisseriaceae bacterium ESL0693]|nr:Abi family protein [Neisseriaceae bacterium ESL0693]